MLTQKTYTVENVRKGHPDKVCDQISDALLDAYLQGDPQSRVAVECFGCHGLLTIGGEVTSRATIDHAAIAREVYRSIGFTNDIEVVVRIVQQSPEISDGVDREGAGDQGIMYGYATAETPELLPLGVVFAGKIVERLDTAEIAAVLPWLRPDGKAQVTMIEGKVSVVVVSVQHDEAVTNETISKDIRKHVLVPIFGEVLDTATVIINPSGAFTIGGFDADTGLTGRKIEIDTYGGITPHGGGCFSGKDATKVDRSAAYMARLAARTLVHAGLGVEVMVSVAYAIGKADPVMLTAVNEQGTDLTSELSSRFDFRPKAIIEYLDLKKPVYQKTAVHGHFFHKDAVWERPLL
jgi:S-adenosylmethionine synthetase